MNQQRQLQGQLRKIVGFHLDENLDWVAELECRHQQHVRHNPPWTHRHWVTTAKVDGHISAMSCGVWRVSESIFDLSNG